MKKKKNFNEEKKVKNNNYILKKRLYKFIEGTKLHKKIKIIIMILLINNRFYNIIIIN